MLVAPDGIISLTEELAELTGSRLITATVCVALLVTNARLRRLSTATLVGAETGQAESSSQQ